ncbi:hypothetical protein GX48_01252 [Paracoccidioides brasiliensis]|nr:hypothetical protein GX48_01252 [Paracoccidioides brasiliensis]
MGVLWGLKFLKRWTYNLTDRSDHRPQPLFKKAIHGNKDVRLKQNIPDCNLDPPSNFPKVAQQGWGKISNYKKLDRSNALVENQQPHHTALPILAASINPFFQMFGEKIKVEGDGEMVSASPVNFIRTGRNV